MSQRLRFPKWFPVFQRRAKRHETSAGLSVHHRRLGCEALEERCLLSLGGEPAGISTAQPTIFADLPVAAQYAISSAIGQDQTAYHAVAGTEGLTLANPANGFTAQVRSGALQIASRSDAWSLALEAFGYGESLEAVAAPRVSASGNRVDCDYGPIDEWFLNGPGGLQQGFVIDPLDSAVRGSPDPALAATEGLLSEPRDDALLTVALDIGGNLRASVNAAGDGLSLARPDGSIVLSYAGLTAYDATGRTLPASMEVRASDGAQELLIHVDAAGAEGPITIDPFVQQAKLMTPDDRILFGRSVAIEGDTVAVAAGYLGWPAGGRAYVFQKIAAGWANMTLAAILGAVDGDQPTSNHSVAISGDTVVVLSRDLYWGSIPMQGIAYVFQKPSGGWANMSETARLGPTDANAFDGFGASVGISGDTVVVGAEWATVGENAHQGIAYVFQKPVAGWVNMTETARLTASDGATSDCLGGSIAISGDMVVAGAPGADIGGNSGQGAAYVFRKPSAGWADMTETAKLTASDGRANDSFGRSAAIEGDTVVVGANHGKVGEDDQQGAAYVFEKPSAGWTTMSQTARLDASDGTGWDFFGASVAISGDTVVVGSRFADDVGAAYVFQKPDTAWTTMTETVKLTASDGLAGAEFGYSVAIDGGTVVVGSPFVPHGSPGWSAAYVYQNDTTPSPERIYATDDDGLLYTLDPQNGRVSVIGVMPAGYMVDIAFDPQGELYGIRSGDLYRIDAQTAQTTRIGPTGAGAVGLVFRSDGTLFGAGSALYTINTQTGEGTLVGDLGDYSAAGDIAFDASGNLFLSASNGSLVRVDPSTGATTLVGPMGYSAVFGLAFSRDGTLYGMSSTSEELFSINTTTGQGTYIADFGGQGVNGAAGADIWWLDYTVTITWPDPAAITYGTALDGTQFNATADVPGTFAYTPPAGTVLDAGNHTLSVLFTPTNTDGFSTATASVTLEVHQATPAIDWPTPAAIEYGTALDGTQLNATASWTVAGTLENVPGTFAYTPAAETVLDAGSHTLSVSFTPADTINYTVAAANVTLEVNKATPLVDWVSPSPIFYGTPLGSVQLSATADVPGEFVYAPSAGTVLGVGSQVLSTTFTPTDTVNYDTVTTDVLLQVRKATPSIDWPPPAITYGTALGSTQLNASASWTVGGTTESLAGTFVYTPAAGAVLGAGDHTLSTAFTPADATKYTTATASVTLRVDRATASIDWPTPAAIAYGTALGSEQLNASASWMVGGTLQSVAGSFDYTPAAGTVLEVGSRALSVTFTPTDAVNYTTATNNVTLQVDRATPQITWSDPAAITYGTALDGGQLNAAAGVPGSFVYTPDAGTVLPAGSQTLSVFFTPTDPDHYTTATASATLEVDKATPPIDWPAPAAIIYGTALDGTQLNAAASVPGSLVYTPGAGTVLEAGRRTLAVTFTPADAANYTTATTSVLLQVDQATPSVLWADPAAITYGTALGSTQLDATASVPGSFVYTPAPGTVLEAGTWTLSVSFTPTDPVNYTTATADVSLQVDKATPTIHWTPETITYGTVLGSSQLNANASWTVGETLQSVVGSFSYTPPAETVLGAGDQTLSAVFAPTDAANYTTAAANVVLRVDKATPTIAWPTPAAITYGTALGSDQSSASASWIVGGTVESVAGTLAYTPPAGTVLAAGSQVLSVTFTPTDTAQYATATADTTLQVNKAAPSIMVFPYDVTYDGKAHTAGGMARGVNGEDLSSGLDLSGTVHTNAGSYTGDPWTFAGDSNYLGTGGTLANSIAKAPANFVIAPYNAIYDGKVHTAGGTARGADGEDLTSGLDLSGTAHVLAGTYAGDPWTFTGDGNHQSASGLVVNSIAKADARIEVTPYSVTYDGNAHRASGVVKGASGEDLTSGLDLSGTTHTGAGSYASDAWTFAGDGNHQSASGTVANSIAKADARIEVTSYNVIYDGKAHTAGGMVRGARGEDLSSGLDLSGTTHTGAGNYAGDLWTFSGDSNHRSAIGTVANHIDKAAPSIVVTAYNVTYDGTAHTAGGTATGVSGEDLSSGLDFSSTTRISAGNYNDPWLFAGNGNYQPVSGTVANRIAKANAVIAVSGYAGVYDKQPHLPAATARGVLGEDLNEWWRAEPGFTNVPGGTARWTFDGSGNYNAASGEAAVAIAPNTLMGPEIFDLAVTPNPARAAPKVDARASTANTGSSTIVAAECFLDKPGKSGKGIRMAASDKKYTSPTEFITATVRALFGKLRRGPHTIYVHAKDATGKWGELVPATFVKDTLGPVTSKPAVVGSPANVPPTVTATIADTSTGGSLLAAAEYFIDKPGKSGKGTPILEAFNSVAQTVTATLDAAKFGSLKQGKHRIFVHGKDTAGNWGRLVAVSFVKDTLGPVISSLKVFPSPAATAPSLTAKLSDKSTGGSKLVAAEYFIDSPGNNGSGTPIPLAANNIALTVTAVLDTALFDSLVEGRHTVYLHAKDAAGNWGSLWMTSFEKTALAARFN